MSRDTLAPVPHATEAEEAVLGAILLDPSLWLELGLGVDDFYTEGHRHVFRAMAEEYGEFGTVDYVSLVLRLRAMGKLEAVGLARVGALTHTASVATVHHHRARLKEYAVKRQGLAVQERLGYELRNGVPTTESLGRARGEIEDLVGVLLSGQDTATAKDAARVMLDWLGALQSSDGLTTTGLAALDTAIRGFSPTDLVVVGGRPGMGKSALATQIALHVAGQGRGVLLASLEMGREQVALRCCCQLRRLDSRALVTGGGLDGDKTQGALLAAVTAFAHLPIHIHDKPGVHVAHLLGLARQIQRRPEGLSLVVVDYLQRMSDPYTRDEYEAVTRISKGLKDLALGLRVPVLALAQLNRSVEQRADKRPVMSDLRSTGQIEQDADKILLCYRDEYYNGEASEAPGVAEIIVAKDRLTGYNGPVRFAWNGPSTRFDALEERYGH